MSNAVTADEILDYIEIFRQLDLVLAGKPTPNVLGAAMNVHLKHEYGDHFVSVTVRRDIPDGKWEVVLDGWSFHASPDNIENYQVLFSRACVAVTGAQAIVERVPFSSLEIAARQDALRTLVAETNRDTGLKGVSLSEHVIETLEARAGQERIEASRSTAPAGTSKKQLATRDW